MEVFNYLSAELLTLLIVVSLWEMVLKGFALYKAGGKRDLYWFIAIFVFNTAGVLPLIYLILQKNKKEA